MLWVMFTLSGKQAKFKHPLQRVLFLESRPERYPGENLADLTTINL
jgi:hypothetical protein